MARVGLVWVEREGLKGLDPAQVARAAGVELGQGEAAVVSVPEWVAPRDLRQRLSGKPVVWVDLEAEVGGGDGAHRLARAAAAVARAAGAAGLGTLAQVYLPQPATACVVAGQGVGALVAARALAATGRAVTLVVPGKAGEPAPGEERHTTAALTAALPAGVEVVEGEEVIGVEGAAGAMRVRLRGGREIRCGAVILAPGGELRPVVPPGWEGEVVVAREAGREGLGGAEGWVHVAAVGLDASPWEFSQLVEAAGRLQGEGVQMHLIITEARVGGYGLERAYREARAKGVLIHRPAPGSFRVQGQALVWHDPILDEDVELVPQRLVVPERLEWSLPGWMQGLGWPEPSRLVPGGPRFAAGRTLRTGLYLVGAARGTPPGPAREAQAAAAAVEASALLRRPGTTVPAVRHYRCATCLTCVRTCPHGAALFTEDHIDFAPAACVGCGMCVANCPARAISPQGSSTPEMLAAIASGLRRCASPKVVVFACRNSAYRAAKELSLKGYQWPAGVLLVPVACAGRVDQGLILAAVEGGAEAVLVAGCHEGNCRSGEGNLLAKLQVETAAGAMVGLGVGRQIRMITIAGNEPAALAAAVEEATQEAAE